ncbi:GNAT family N-acetyltransferase [Vibrio profundum]|uniref:GNAT family N-acetyltransferase n=1 Tax=Vibrio profundum TaxID=2910247 RepID=UPI003D0AF5E0
MISTERLLLRPFRTQDEAEMIALLNNPEFMAYSPSGDMDRHQAKQRFDSLLTAFDDFGIGKFAVVEESSGELIGYCGVAYFEYAGCNKVELGYRLKTTARGKGYALEASLATLSDAKQRGYERVMALSEPSNVVSQHILRKLGFTPLEIGKYQGMAVQYFEKVM